MLDVITWTLLRDVKSLISKYSKIVRLVFSWTLTKIVLR